MTKVGHSVTLKHLFMMYVDSNTQEKLVSKISADFQLCWFFKVALLLQLILVTMVICRMHRVCTPKLCKVCVVLFKMVQDWYRGQWSMNTCKACWGLFR